MEDAKAAWADVGAKFGGLGEKLKEHFEHARPTGQAEGEAGAEGAGATAAPGEGAAPGAGAGGAGAGGAGAGGASGAGAGGAGTTDAVKDALRTLGEALSGAVEAVGAAAKDPEITGEMRQVGQAFVNALAATFTDVGEDLRGAFSRSRSGEGGGGGAGGEGGAGTGDASSGSATVEAQPTTEQTPAPPIEPGDTPS
jgi:hypothetical protein